MKFVSIAAYAGVAALIALGVAMVGSNLSRSYYEEYATQRLSGYLKEQGCSKTPSLLDNLNKFNCAKFIDSASPIIKQIIKATTQEQDYLLLSVYRTELKINSLKPAYKVETVGAWSNFFIYKAKNW